MVKEIIQGHADDLVCPLCGARDYHNRMGGRPWCFACNRELVQRSDLKKFNRKFRRANKPKDGQVRINARGVNIVDTSGHNELGLRRVK